MDTKKNLEEAIKELQSVLERSDKIHKSKTAVVSHPEHLKTALNHLQPILSHYSALCLIPLGRKILEEASKMEEERIKKL